MGRAAKETTPATMDFEAAEGRSDYTVDFVTVRQYTDMAPMFVGLPDGRCQCPHWGVMVKGRMTVTYADRVEVFEAGDAFYMPPGHIPAVDAGTEFTMFSPTDLLAATDAAIAKGMEAAAAAS
jgi:hypothetical protein